MKMSYEEARSYVNWYIDTDVFEPHVIKPIHTKRYHEALEVLRRCARTYDPVNEIPRTYLEATEFLDWYHEYAINKSEYDDTRVLIAKEIIVNARKNR